MLKRKYSKFETSSESDSSSIDKTVSKRPCFSSVLSYEASPQDEEIEGFRIHNPENSQKCEFFQNPEFYLSTYMPGISGCRKISEYKLLSKINEGTFGVVFKSRDKQSDKIYAVKKLKLENDEEFPLSSLREIYTLKKCGKHENIISLREVVTAPSSNKIYLVMDYMDYDLKQFMQILKTKNQKFSLTQVKNLMFQLLNGISYLHDEYVLHRDLKPSNILLNKQGILKIGDLGSAREYDDPIKAYTTLVVTLWYRPPELLLGTKFYSTHIDIWSIGCIFAELLTLEPLFYGTNEQSQVKKIFEKLGTPNEEIWPGYTKLPNVKYLNFPQFPGGFIKEGFGSTVNSKYGFEFLKQFLEYDPERRISADVALTNIWFCGDPWPCSCEKLAKWIQCVAKNE